MSAGGAAATAMPFYGWRVVGATFTILTLAFGAAYSFPAFFAPLALEFPGSRGNIALLFGICGLMFFAVGAASGPLADRIGSRRIVSAGIVLVGLGLIAASFATALWQLMAAYGLGVGFGVGLAYVPAVGPVQRWFVRQRGRASGFAVAGIGVGTFGGPLLAVALMEASSWRTAWLAMGIAVVLLGVVAARLLIDSPGDVGQRPDGDPPPAALPGTAQAPPPTAAAARAAQVGWALRPALRTRPFILLYLSGIANGMGLFLPFVHVAPYARDLGLGQGLAVFLASLIGIGSIAGRFVLGSAADRFGRRPTLVATFVGMTAMLAFWPLAQNAWLIGLFAVVFGTCYGGFVALIPAVIVDYLGTRNAGGIIGALYTSVAPGTLLGPALGGYAFDLWGSYTIPALVGAGFMALATALVWAAPDPARWRAANPVRG